MKSKENVQYNQLIGLTEAEAEAVASDLGASLRVLEKDGKRFMHSCEWQPNRVNVALSAGVIIDILGIG